VAKNYATMVCKTLRPNYDSMSWLHFFFLSRVSHKGEFYLEMFLMRQYCTKQLNYHISHICVCVGLLDFGSLKFWT
jgi:hypothetical protein